MVHDLKILSPFFNAICEGVKTFEIRKNDRNFNVGDILHLKEYCPKTKTYSDYHVNVKVIYITVGASFGLEKGFVVMGIQLLREH